MPTIIDAVLKIGPFEFDFPVVQAALAGYSDAPMRLIARRFGVPYALQDVKLDTSVAHSEKLRRRILGTLDPADHPIGGQLIGAEPASFAEAAGHMVERGFDVIDINFGCPVKKVLGRRRGGFLLSTPRQAIEIMKAVRAVVPPAMPVTVKLRRGIDDTPESERRFFEVFDAAVTLGLAAVTVHGRSVAQRYCGPSDWSFLARLRRYAPGVTLLGSGDLFTAEAIRRMFEATGVDGVSVARGCIGNPWIFRDARELLAGRPLPPPPSVTEQSEVIQAHFALSVAEHGERRAARLMRKVGIRYAEVHPHPKAVRMAFVQAADAAAWLRVLDEWYDPTRDWPPGRRKEGPTDLIAPGAE